MTNDRINKARIEKNDEFYTQLEDIENELNFYKDTLVDKIIYCNCDNYKWSNFYKYFKDNFKDLKIKLLIATSYSINGEKTHKVIYDGENEIVEELIGDGDFRSQECINILKESDIIITNPPFSLFRDIVDLSIQYNKKFLIVGHQNNISYKNIFNLIKDKKIWLGVGFKGSVGFFINKHYEDFAKAKEKKDGFIRVSGVNWFTNLHHNKKIESLVLEKTYNDQDYKKYDDCDDCIEVPQTKLIPKDYFGYMGVPLSYLLKHNPNDFEICGLNDHRAIAPNVGKTRTINGQKIYKRIIIKRLS